MKNAKIIIAVLVLLGVASLAKAQIVVSSTNASTTKIYEKSGREKGWVIRPEGFVGTNAGPIWLYGLKGTACYQFNPYFAIGGGGGYLINSFYNNKPWNEDYSYENRPSSIPIFANARVYFIDRKWSPFLDIELGYMIPITSGVEHYDVVNEFDWIHDIYTHSMRGFTTQVLLGIQFKSIDFGITAKILNTHTAMEKHRFDDWEEHDDYTYDYKYFGYLGLSIGYNFQLSKN